MAKHVRARAIEAQLNAQVTSVLTKDQVFWLISNAVLSDDASVDNELLDVRTRCFAKWGELHNAPHLLETSWQLVSKMVAEERVHLKVQPLVDKQGNRCGNLLDGGRR